MTHAPLGSLNSVGGLTYFLWFDIILWHKIIYVGGTVPIFLDIVEHESRDSFSSYPGKFLFDTLAGPMVFP